MQWSGHFLQIRKSLPDFLHLKSRSAGATPRGKKQALNLPPIVKLSNQHALLEVLECH
jgi:hypothetical protein